MAARQQTRDTYLPPGIATQSELDAFSKFIVDNSPDEIVQWLKQGYADYSSGNVGLSQPAGENRFTRNGYENRRADQGWMFFPLHVNNMALTDRSPITHLFELFPDVHSGLEKPLQAKLSAAFIALSTDTTDTRRAEWAADIARRFTQVQTPRLEGAVANPE